MNRKKKKESKEHVHTLVSRVGIKWMDGWVEIFRKTPERLVTLLNGLHFNCMGCFSGPCWSLSESHWYDYPPCDVVPVTRRNFKLLSFLVMAASFRSLPGSSNNKWYYSRQQIDNSPSRRAGLDPDKELSYRQQAANLLQDMGQRLNVYLLSRDG